MTNRIAKNFNDLFRKSLGLPPAGADCCGAPKEPETSGRGDAPNVEEKEVREQERVRSQE